MFSKNSLKMSELGICLDKLDNHNQTILMGRLKALDRCSGDFISFIDDDDETLLLVSHLEAFAKLDFRCLFTNSLITDYTGITTTTKTEITEWKLDDENRGFILPHQTFIFRKDAYCSLVEQTCYLIKHEKLSENSFDFVLRLVCSRTLGWKYFPEITYCWHKNSTSTHLAFNKENYCKIRSVVKSHFP